MGKIISKVLSVLAVPAVAVIAMPWAGILDRLETRSAFAGEAQEDAGGTALSGNAGDTGIYVPVAGVEKPDAQPLDGAAEERMETEGLQGVTKGAQLEGSGIIQPGDSEKIQPEGTGKVQPEDSEKVQPEGPGKTRPENSEIIQPEGAVTGSPSADQLIAVASDNGLAIDPAITILAPSGWTNKTAFVEVRAEAEGMELEDWLKSARARIGQNGSWADITDGMGLEISENCTVYVELTDKNGKAYTKHKAMKCIDTVKPSLNAAVDSGILTVQCSDADSGVKAVYVNGFEFTGISNDTLVIRMQQFDTGYEYFTVQVLDYAGNMSELYRVKNPYYSPKEGGNGSGGKKAELPVSAEPTPPASAKAGVTSHEETNGDGSVLLKEKEDIDKAKEGDGGSGQKGDKEKTGSPDKQKKQAFAEADREEESDASKTADPDRGKEFYTIEAASGKIFYLVIDRNGEDETAYFLTEITENDLLNVTQDESRTLPKNSAVPAAAIPAMETAQSDGAVTGHGILQGGEDAENRSRAMGALPEAMPGLEEAVPDVLTDTVSDDAPEMKEKSHIPAYAALGIIAAIFMGAVLLLKYLKKRNYEDYEEDEEADDDEDYVEEQDENETGENVNEDEEGDGEDDDDEDEEDDNDGDDWRK